MESVGNNREDDQPSAPLHRPTATYVIVVATATLGASFQWYNMTVTNVTQQVLIRWINETYNERNEVELDVSHNDNERSSVNKKLYPNIDSKDSKVIHGNDQQVAILSKQELDLYFSIMTSALCVGAMVGSFSMHSLANRCGRRNGLIVNGIVNVVAGLLVVAARLFNVPELMILARIVYGFCLGVACGLVPIYLAEISPAHLRGASVTVIHIIAASSEWISLVVGMPSVLGNDTGWPWAFALPAIPALIMVIVLQWLPESPSHLLLTKGDLAGAEHALAALHGRAEAHKIGELRANSASDKAESNAGFLDVLRNRSLRKPLTICLVAAICQMCPQSVMFAYSTDILVSAGLAHGNAQIVSLVSVLTYFVTLLPAGYLIERWGRRRVCLIQMVGCSTCLLVLSASVFIHNTLGVKQASAISALSVVVFMLAYAVGAAVPWLLPSEMFSQRYRASVGGLASLTNWMAYWLVTSSYLTMKHHLTTEGSFVPFLVVSVVCIRFMYCNMPETRDRMADDVMNNYMRIMEIESE